MLLDGLCCGWEDNNKDEHCADEYMWILVGGGDRAFSFCEGLSHLVH